MDSLQRGPLVQQCLSTDPAWFSPAPAPWVLHRVARGALGFQTAVRP